MPSIPAQPQPPGSVNPSQSSAATPPPVVVAPISFDLQSLLREADATPNPLTQNLSVDIQHISEGKAQPNYRLVALDLDPEPSAPVTPPKEGPQHFKPVQKALNSFLGTTEFKLDTKEDDINPNKPVAFQTEHKLNANMLEFKGAHLQSTTSFESNFKARLEGTESEAGVFNTEKPADLQGKLGVKQKFSGQMMGFKYEADAFAQQGVAAKDFDMGALAPVNMGASAALGYTLGDANMQVKASTTGEGKQQTQATLGYKLSGDANMQLKTSSNSEGKAEALATLNYTKGGAKGSVFAGQEFNPAQTIDKVGARLDMGGDTIQSYVSGEMRSSGQETLKTGLTMKFAHLKLGTEAGLTGTDQRFNQPHLRQTVGFERNGFALDASVDPLSFSSEPNFQVGLRFKKTF
jgi:hypothetical protein